MAPNSTMHHHNSIFVAVWQFIQLPFYVIWLIFACFTCYFNKRDVPPPAAAIAEVESPPLASTDVVYTPSPSVIKNEQA